MHVLKYSKPIHQSCFLFLRALSWTKNWWYHWALGSVSCYVVKGGGETVPTRQKVATPFITSTGPSCTEYFVLNQSSWRFYRKTGKINIGIKNHKLVGPYWEGFPSTKPVRQTFSMFISSLTSWEPHLFHGRLVLTLQIVLGASWVDVVPKKQILGDN